VLVAALVEISLLLHGVARLLPLLLAAACAAGAATYLQASQRRLEALRQKAELTRSIFLTLARVLEMKDPQTASHSARVAMYSRDIAASLGLDRAAQSRVHLAGLLHDVGKVGISDEILFKPSDLTASERRIMEDHARLSAEALAGIPGFGDVARAVYAHQEHMDGSGYPEGLAGEQIPLASRIIAVADAFEAITSDRPYRAAHPPETALEIISGAVGRQFDDRVVTALAALVESGSTDYRYGSLADFAEEWARATESLEIETLDQEALEPFEVPPPHTPRLALAASGGAGPTP
jgi:putative nucleotidyltransferase with HDIG domain